MPGFIINGTGGATDRGPESRAAEPKRKYRWLFAINGTDSSSSKSFLYLRSCKRPSYTLSPIEEHHNQEVIWHMGKTSWDDVDISWYDMENPVDVCGSIYNWMQAAVYNINLASAQHPLVYKKDSTITLTDHNGAPTESWRLYNSWPYKIDMDTLDYSSNEILMLTATLKYDRAAKVTPEVPPFGG